MNQADILKLAEEAGFECSVGNRKTLTLWAINQCRFDGNCDANVTQELTRFAELVAQHEREASGKAVEVLRELAALEILQSDASALSFADPLSSFGDNWKDEYNKIRKEWTRRQSIARREAEEILRVEAIRTRNKS